jgi:DegV family protein with EDD domain
LKIKIVTDSTSDLPNDIAEELGVAVVPAYINIGEESFLDGVNLSRQEFYTRLPEYPQSPTTAAPGLAAFAGAYEKAADEGAEAVISIHVAESLSATINTARQAKELVSRIPVWVVDSGQVSLGLGLQAVEAAKSVLQGRQIEEIIQMLSKFRERTYVYRAILGSMVKIKPIISIHDSLIKMEMAVTTGRAFKRIHEMVSNLAPLEYVSFVHTLAQSKVDELQHLLHEYIPRTGKTIIHEVTPAIGAHIGPGAAGVICVRS